MKFTQLALTMKPISTWLLVGLTSTFPIFSKSVFGAQDTLVSPPSVELDYGTFLGLANTTTGVISFLGVPYADPPTEDLRWREAVSPPSSNLGVVDAKTFGNSCISPSQGKLSSGQSEDCLFGNVFMPGSVDASSNPQGLPVLVWFHGGGFQLGDTHFNPNVLLTSPPTMDQIIFVSFEYRLGQFGFLAGNNVRQDGVLNAGLHDQRAALRWVQRYISKFGGDKNRVTVGGQSVGATSAMFHLIANGGDNENLFRAALGESGPLASLLPPDDSYVESIFQNFSSKAGCTGPDVMTCLRAAPVDVLTQAGHDAIAEQPTTLFLFQPVFDGTFLNERAVSAFNLGHFAKVPVLFGSNSDDGLHWTDRLSSAANTSAPNATEDTVFTFIVGQFPKLTREFFDAAVELHYPLSKFDGSFAAQQQAMYGEMRYMCTPLLIARSVSEKGEPAYMYRYFNSRLGSAHGSELQGLLGLPSQNATAPPPDSQDETLWASIREYWTSFVARGCPNTQCDSTTTPVPSGDPNAPPEWSTVPSNNSSSSGPQIQNLLQRDQITMESPFPSGLEERCDFWHGLADLYT